MNARTAGASITVSCAIGVPNLGEYADPGLLASIALDAEDCGWDGFFIWDHLVGPEPARAATDPWVALSVAAERTTRIRLGAMVTPLARRRPWKVARESVALDLLSDGRLVFGAGLGAAPAAEFEPFGEEGDARVRAEKLDDALTVLAALWSGEPVVHRGPHYTVDSPGFLPTPVQSPRIPVWIAGRWPNRRPFRRAARWDGVFPTTVIGVGDEPMAPPSVLGEILEYTLAHRSASGSFDVALECRSTGIDPVADAELVAEYAAVGLTWWVEKIGWFRGDLDEMRERVRKGPPGRGG